MSKIIILIATTVIAINLLYTILPSGDYEKYCKHIFGLILLLVVVGTFVKFDITSEVLRFDENIPVFDSVKITETVQQNTESIICENIGNILKSKRVDFECVSVKLENHELLEVKVKLCNDKNKKEIISLISSYCDINESNIVIE